MKIAHVAPPWIAIPPQNYGGTEHVIYNLVEEQVARGHDVTLFAPADAKTSARLVSFFPKSLNRDGVPWEAHLKAFFHLYKSLEYAGEFDVIHTHLSSSADLYIFPLTARLATPHVTTLHSRFPFDRVQFWLGDADQFYMEWAPFVPVVAISEAARDEVSYPLNFVGVVHHGLPVSYFKPEGEKPGDYFAWLGRFCPAKGAHLDIEAAKRAGVPLVLAGTIQRQQESIQYFERAIKPHIDDAQIRYIGPVDMKRKLSLLSRARGLLNPIQWEDPFGMVMIEAMALGCPVISCARGAAPEIVVHGKTGFLVNDVNDMVRYIARIDEIDRGMTRLHAERNFAAHAMAEKYMRIYKQVIAQSKTARLSQAATKTLRTPSSGSLVAKAALPVHIPYPVSTGATALKAEQGI